jgi:hypothetical protein
LWKARQERETVTRDPITNEDILRRTTLGPSFPDLPQEQAPAAPQAPEESAPAPTAQAPGQPAPSRTIISRSGTSTHQKSRETANATILDIARIMNDAKKAGEDITGIVGTLKSKGGGFARQAGVPVSTRASRLDKALKALQAQVGPAILNEKKLSNDERARLAKIVGDLDFGSDEIEIRDSLAFLVGIINKAEE